MNRIARNIIKLILVVGALAAAAYFVPLFVVGYFLCGFWDLSRNRGLDLSMAKQYFAGNGVWTWFTSPFNIMLDILALPYWNRGIWELSDLPAGYQDEIKSLMATAKSANLIERLEEQLASAPRVMIFFKWYGRNLESSIDVPEFHADFKYVRTIGVSAFKKRESTWRHFGPIRPSFRVLFCLNDDINEDAFIRVGNVENRWKEKPLFIFDDTLMHQSFNETDAPRHVLFVDILRPSLIPFFFDAIVRRIGLALLNVNRVFYSTWKFVK